MKLGNYTVIAVCAALMSVLGFAEGQWSRIQDETFEASDEPGARREGHGMHKGDHSGAVKERAAGRAQEEGQKIDKPSSQRAGYIKESRDSSRIGDTIRRGDRIERRGQRFDRTTFGDARRGRQWYQSYRNRFWASDFYWPRATVFTTFFSGLIPQLEGFDIPQALLNEIRQLQSMLAQLNPNSALSEALRQRLVKVIGELVELVPGIDVQGIFEGNR